MIHKNSKLGNTKNVTIVELGTGDIKVGYIKQPDEGYTGVSFKNSDKFDIGHLHDDAGETTDEYNPEAVIIFTNPKSIDVVIEQLNLAKCGLIKMQAKKRRNG